MQKIIIGIHGLGNKPPKNILKDWWLESIREGFKKYNYPVPNFDFEFVYWADILHKEPLDPDEKNRFSSRYLPERYEPEQNNNYSKPNRLRKKAFDYLEKYYEKILVNEVMSMNHPSLTDLFIHFNMKELEEYYSSEEIYYQGVKRLVRDIIIERLTDVMKKHRDKKILLIAHSMGSMIAHDALIDYVPDIKIDTLITIGSPLGQKYVLNKYHTVQNGSAKNKLKVPENIQKNWFNLSDVEDQVAINHSLAEIYKPSSKGLTVIDKLVNNNYSHSGTWNPHKSFGYLRTHEMTEILNLFLKKDENKFLTWFKKLF